MTVLITEGMHKAGIQRLNEVGIKTVFPSDTYEKNGIDIIVVRSVFEINEKTLQRFPNLKVVAKLGTGLDNVDQESCQSRGVEVVNVPAMNSISTAEFAVTQILSMYKSLFEIHERVKQRDFRRALYYGRELTDLTAGVIGYGNVGKAIVARLKPFVKKVYICDNLVDGNREDGNLHFITDQGTILTSSDMVILAVPLKGNEKMVNNSFLSKLKKDCLLVNISRGGLVDDSALIEFLKQNLGAKYYCDVIDPEPDYNKEPEEQDYQNELLALPNVVFTPHIANLTDECQSKIAIAIADRIIRSQAHE